MNGTEVQNPRHKLYAYHNWLMWLTILSVALKLVLCTLSCCCLYAFGSVLACAKPAHARVSEALLPALQTLSLSFLTNSSSDSKAFQRFIAISGSPTAVHRAFLFFDVKARPQSQPDLFTCTTVLHGGHTFLRRIDLIYSITLWAYLPEPPVKDLHKSLSSTEKPQYRVLQVTWSHITVTYIRVMERYKEILHVKKMADLP